MYSEACSSVSVADYLSNLYLCCFMDRRGLYGSANMKSVLLFLRKLVHLLEIREELTNSAADFMLFIIHSH